MLDLLIRNAQIVDGTGRPPYAGDIGIANGRITQIGAIAATAATTINACGRAACPGFIDGHTHTDGISESPGALNMLGQGVTTVVSGNCGSSRLPVGRALTAVEEAAPAINYATLVGHGTIRTQAMGGPAEREPSRDELTTMRRLTEQAMSEGALGLSSGLFYVPGAYAGGAELAAVSEIVAACGGVYATHKRSAGGQVFAALAETADVGRRTGVSVQVSHLKILHKSGRTRADRAEDVLAAIAGYRAEGIDITYDLHPFPATFTSLAAVVVPPWVSRDGRLIERLKAREIRERVRAETTSNIAWIGGGDRITITRFRPDPSLEGRTLADIAAARGRDETCTAMDLIVEGAPECIFHALRADDVATFICGPSAMVASDGGIVPTQCGVVHPRNYGTFPRVLREFVRERQAMTLETAVRKMTEMPARKFGIRERGTLTKGMRADLVVLDPDTIAEGATFDAPHEFAVGISHVLVNGRVAWDEQGPTQQRAGHVLRS